MVRNEPCDGLKHRFSIPRNPVSELAHARDLANPGVETGFLCRCARNPGES
jgi:hypothetical protein